MKEKELKEVVNLNDEIEELNLGELGNDFVNYDRGYICDIISEVADNNVGIYYYQQIEWAKDNSSYIEDAVKDFGIDSSNFSFYGIIQQGWYYANEEDLYEHLEDNIKNFVYDYIIKNYSEEITEEQFDDLNNEIVFNDSNARLEGIIKQIDDIMERTEEDR